MSGKVISNIKFQTASELSKIGKKYKWMSIRHNATKRVTVYYFIENHWFRLGNMMNMHENEIMKYMKPLYKKALSKPYHDIWFEGDYHRALTNTEIIKQVIPVAAELSTVSINFTKTKPQNKGYKI